MIEAFEYKFPTAAEEDWKANPATGTRQTHVCESHEFDDAIFFVFTMFPKETGDVRALRLDPRLGHWIVGILREHDPNLVSIHMT